MELELYSEEKLLKKESIRDDAILTLGFKGESVIEIAGHSDEYNDWTQYTYAPTTKTKRISSSIKIYARNIIEENGSYTMNGPVEEEILFDDEPLEGWNTVNIDFGKIGSIPGVDVGGSMIIAYNPSAESKYQKLVDFCNKKKKTEKDMEEIDYLIKDLWEESDPTAQIISQRIQLVSIYEDEVKTGRITLRVGTEDGFIEEGLDEYNEEKEALEYQRRHFSFDNSEIGVFEKLVYDYSKSKMYFWHHGYAKASTEQIFEREYKKNRQKMGEFLKGIEQIIVIDGSDGVESRQILRNPSLNPDVINGEYMEDLKDFGYACINYIKKIESIKKRAD